MRRHQVTRWLLCALVLGACSKKKDSTELVVTVWSDFAVPDEMDSLRLRVAGKERSIDHPFQLSDNGKSGTYKIPVQLGLVPAGAKDGAISIMAIGARKGSDMVWQQASLQFIPDQAHELVLYLAKACKNVECDEKSGLTCEKGACSRPIAVKTSELPSYTAGQAPTTPITAMGAKPDASVPDAGREAGQPDTFKAGRPDTYVPNPDTRLSTSLGDSSMFVTPDSPLVDTNRVPDLGLDTLLTLPDTAPLLDLGKLDTQRDTTPVRPDTDVCVAESDQEFCDRKGVTCGGLQGYDNCGASRSVSSCGFCPADAAIDTRLPDACAPETDPQMCSRYSRICGTLSENDNCGQYRSVSCGTCTADAGPDTCVAESNQRMCSRYDVFCGDLWGYDNCGQYRYISSCGNCDGGSDASGDVADDL